MYKIFKRGADFASALCLLIVISPLFIVVCILVRNKLGSPVFFKQVRTGKHGRTFYLYKFRTMTDERDEYGNLLPDDKRLVGLGKWLRSTSDLKSVLLVICVPIIIFRIKRTWSNYSHISFDDIK